MFGAVLFSHAFANEDLKIIQATKNIEYLSEKIAKDYLYLHSNPNKIATRAELSNIIERLEEDFRFVAKSTNKVDTKNILDFLSYSKDQIKDILDKDISIQKAVLILDHSEALSEGAQSILKTYGYDSLKDKDIRINLMRISKFYMASHAGINPAVNKKQLQHEISMLEMKLKGSKNSLNDFWYAARDLLDTQEDYFIPNIVFIVMNNMENLTKKYEKNN